MSGSEEDFKKNNNHAHQVVPANQVSHESWDPRSESLMTRLGLNGRSYTRAPVRLTYVDRRVYAAGYRQLG
jgi:hypothetical protein